MDLRIGICDDAPDWREKTRETVKHCTDQMANSVEIYSFQNGNELLSEEHPPMHILFMDIEMSDENGIDLAMEVNRKWPKWSGRLPDKFLVLCNGSLRDTSCFTIL